MSNFTFLHNEWPDLHAKMKKAEERVNNEPVSTATYCRMALEEAIHVLYEKDYIELPYNTELANLMTQEEIKSIIPYHILDGLHVVRKTGNKAVHHGNRVTKYDALVSIKHIYTFLKWFAGNYSDEPEGLPDRFDETYIPKVGAQQRQVKLLQEESAKEQAKLLKQIEELKEQNRQQAEAALQSEESFRKYKEEINQARDTMQFQRQTRAYKPASEYTEHETRQHFIDAALNEAGWFDLRQDHEIEYPVKGMPQTNDNPHGNGFADYVLWGDDGKPLAVIEAKRTSKDAEEGKHQAFLYADCLEIMHGQRPIIFYTNGFESHIWDDTFYSASRRVHGFYTKDELQLLIQHRSERKDIRKAQINKDIAGRPYQSEAIQRVAESFVVDAAKGGLRGNKRSALLVMATGSGKTRTAAALVDVLMKNNWAKRVLFLADRNALVTQAKNSFNEHLPSVSAVDLTKEKENDTTRMVFSTYPTMMNLIDTARNAEERFYGVGHFDLIIIDEAHRSVYNRYGAIFEYFDAMLVGLTATPKDSIDHNTFELFECADEDPTFSFELKSAVDGGYLVDYQNYDVSTKFLREGIRYADLSEDEQVKYEETFQDEATGLFPEEIESSAMNKWLFNKDTVNKVLDKLMTDGLKIEGGDKIGRTIIFAVNQRHAKFIVDQFNDRYPDKPSGFIGMIHNKVSHKQSLIDAFCDHHKENNPQIAVSVDLMDTGIDAPRVLNLVFFKVVRSYAKFWQMIGRGTRLCPNVFGPDQDKKEFLILDVCQNFEFFGVNTKGKVSSVVKPITQKIFEARLQLSRLLAETGEEENLQLSVELLDILHSAISALDDQRFQVKMHLRQVEQFKERDKWNNLSADDVHEITSHLSGLPIPERIDEGARRFDLLMLNLQISILEGLSSRQAYSDKLMNTATLLSKKYTIPQVQASKKLIDSMKDPNFYANLKQKKLEEIRTEIRDLIQYLEFEGIRPIYTDILDADVEMSVGKSLSANGLEPYRSRVERFVRENKDQLIIHKLHANEQITQEELKRLEEILFDGVERGTKEDFIAAYGDEPLEKFIRSILGLEVEAANQAFGDFIRTGSLKADQITFLNTIIQYLTVNGTIDKSMLFEPPFTHINDEGLVGVFDDAQATKIISIIDGINENAGVG
ncbi:DEAD/DEAH box helicase family protein [Reichenbachiella sp.]|uniref:DEAD/DEAH box helicase family protein n=1 Tax=Reichenbachiella sp. TaxID=2184521 RepID=UPI003B597230